MRKVFILAAAAATMLMASCSKEAENKVFKAEAEAAAESGKVAYSGGSLLWQAGDEVSIYDGSSNSAVYAVASGDGTSRCEFAYSSGSALDAGSYTAVSPAAIRTGVSTISLPATQSSADGSLTGLPMYAVSSSENLKFYNLCGVVRFRLSASSDASVRSIAVTTNANTNGAATISGSGTSVTLGTLGGTATTTLSLGTAQGIASAKDFYMYLPAGSYSSFVITMTAEGGASCTKTANSAIVIERGKITTITLSGLSFGGGLPEGALSGVFSVASGRTVHFSQGNLQYQASTGTWRFATNQYDCIGNSNSSISSTNSGWIDLFGWGTSGWNSGANCYQPWSTSTNYADYYPGGAYTNSLTGSYANADWGVNNAISNGGNAAGLWRTLTHDEWSYLFNSRTGCSTVGGTSNGRYALAQVNGVGGVIVFPDSYTHPSGVAAPQNVNNDSPSQSWGNNSYSASDWGSMQTAGAVFLPAAGNRNGSSVYDVGSNGLYWSSSYYTSYGAWYVSFLSGDLFTESAHYRSYGRSVRLVRG
ncbi:MAG: hypothetical protein IJU81_03130 [Bacteroidales bacterium]|nr:hypothetical protein [Bacteroidales bacterium]